VKNLFYRQFIAIVAVNFVPLIVISTLLYRTIVSDYQSSLVESMRIQVSLLSSTTESALLFDDKKAGAILLSSLEQDSATRYAQIYNKDRQLFAEYKRFGQTVDVFFSDFDKNSFFKNDNIYFYHQIVNNGEYLGFIVMSSSTRALTTQKRHLLLSAITMLCGSLFLAIFLNWLLQRLLSAPIKDLIDLVSYVSKHKKYHKRLDPARAKGLGKLIVGVNAMLDTIELHEIEHKEDAAQIIQASKLATLGEMATSVAHELNQPLNIIRMAASNGRRMISQGTAGPEYLDNKLERIEAQSARAAAIIDHMRMFGREAKEEPELIDPRKVVANALDLMGEQLRLAGIEILIVPSEERHSILGHTIQLEQVILNLFTNARDAMAAKKGEAKITLRIFEDDAGLHITAEDTGGGIPEDVLPHIFDPFYTTKEMGQGTGLGLSVSYGIIHDMNGTIIAENINDGARFTITLPIVR
jgi:C4-dicarboxylate-specific signal transduction histidine kinase